MVKGCVLRSAGMAVALLIVMATPGQAAVLVCGALVEGDGRDAPAETEARRLALESWQAKAGPGVTWRLATNKGITCVKTPAGRSVCKAAGHPCVLRQVPPEAPLKRLMPSAPGQGT